jgi:hypothetical protein
LSHADLQDNGQAISMKTEERYVKALALAFDDNALEQQAAKEFVRRMDALHPGIKETTRFVDVPYVTERRFYTPCFFPYVDDDQLNKIRRGLIAQRDRLVKEKRRTDEKIKFLLTLVRKTERKPALPQYRAHDWFDINDSLVCYVGHWVDRILPDVWVTAKAVDGYRHHDGMVSVVFDKKLHNGDFLDGHGGGFGMSRPEVMHRWEYEYLRSHLDYATVWLDGSKLNLENFEPDQMLSVLETGYMHVRDESGGDEPATQE